MRGQRFGRLKVLERGPNLYGQAAWVCECRCGNTVLIAGYSLRRGASRSCGCLMTDVNRAAATKHGLAHKVPEYGVWVDMKRRCYNRNYRQFKDWGGRGITVCPRWRESFAAFYADMGPRPGPEYTIERKNNDGNYDADNCVWATRLTQRHNRRDSCPGLNLAATGTPRRSV